MGKKSAEIQQEKANGADVDESAAAPGESLTYEDKIAFAIPIARPMASRKTAKKCYKVVKKARAQGHKHLVRGLKLIQKAIKSDQKGFVVIAGDTDPMDVVSHLPCLCEANNTSYVWVPSQVDLGHAATAQRIIACFIKQDESYEKYYQEAYEAIKDLPIPV